MVRPFFLHKLPRCCFSRGVIDSDAPAGCKALGAVCSGRVTDLKLDASGTHVRFNPHYLDELDNSCTVTKLGLRVLRLSIVIPDGAAP